MLVTIVSQRRSTSPGGQSCDVFPPASLSPCPPQATATQLQAPPRRNQAQPPPTSSPAPGSLDDTPFAPALSSLTGISDIAHQQRDESNLLSETLSPYLGNSLDRRPLTSSPHLNRSSVFIETTQIHHVGPARVVVLLHHPQDSIQHHRWYQRSSCYSRQCTDFLQSFLLLPVLATLVVNCWKVGWIVAGYGR